MDFVYGIILIIVVLGYPFISWKIGRSFKKQVLIAKELKNVREKAEERFIPNDKYFALKKKSFVLRLFYSIVLLLVLVLLVYFLFHDEVRIGNILFIVLGAFSPVFMGYEGIIPIPIPGLSIKD